jgi:hypothetical protein
MTGMQRDWWAVVLRDLPDLMGGGPARRYWDAFARACWSLILIGIGVLADLSLTLKNRKVDEGARP